MSENQPYLKGANVWWLRFFIAINIAVFLSVILGSQLGLTSIEHFMKVVLPKEGLMAIVLPLATILLDGLLNDLLKARIVFWRWNNPLPGCRAFSEIMKADPRIDLIKLRAKFEPLPTTASEQNALWYRLYKIHSDKQFVWESHRYYLLTRDMAALAFIFVIAFAGSALFFSVNKTTALIYVILLFIQYALVAITAKNHGNRFVANVLAEESVA